MKIYSLFPRKEDKKCHTFPFSEWENLTNALSGDMFFPSFGAVFTAADNSVVMLNAVISSVMTANGKERIISYKLECFFSAPILLPATSHGE